MKKMINNVWKGQRGITGLETAIILIAFVVVASVFAYTVLSAGLFSTQKSGEAVYAGLEESRSALEINGSIILCDDDDDNYVDRIEIPIRTSIGGEPVDFTPKTISTTTNNKVVLTYDDSSQFVDDMCWTVTKLGNEDGDNMLEDGEVFQFSIPRLQTGTTNGLNPDLGKNTAFSIGIKPPGGATLLVERTTPRSIDPIINMK